MKAIRSAPTPVLLRPFELDAQLAPVPTFPLRPSQAILAAFLILLSVVVSAKAACDTFAPGVSLGNVFINDLKEASGIAASRRNPGVLWTHNDGSSGAIFAIATNGAHLATFFLNTAVLDTEDIAVGPGPASGVSYLYVGDIGSGSGRNRVQILRVEEPFVDLAWAGNPRSAAFSGVAAFPLAYPSGGYDAESLLVDPASSDVFVVTKQDGAGQLFRTNLNDLPAGVLIRWLAAGSVPFSKASGGDISASGKQIVLRREDFAMVWDRFNGEAIGTALARAGTGIPVIGPPVEPNGEGIAMLPNGTGYVTISEGTNPAIYYFESQCPRPPRFTQPLKNQSATVGSTVKFRVRTKGYPAPTYRWRFNGKVIPGQTGPMLKLARVTSAQAGQYKVAATTASGRVRSEATLRVTP